MQIISKKRLRFQNFEITVDPRSNEKVAKLVRSIEVAPSMRRQDVPDWIVNDDLFDLCVDDGSVIPIGEIPKGIKASYRRIITINCTTYATRQRT